MQKGKINWWALIAIVVIGVPMGFVGTGIYNRLHSQDNPDTIVPPPIDSLFLTISRDNFNLQSGADRETFEIKSNTDWSVSIEDETEWLSVTPMNGSGEGTVYLTVAENDGKTDRSTSLKVLWNGNNEEKMEQQILVTQEKKKDEPDPPTPGPTPNQPTSFLSISPTSVAFVANGGTKPLSVRSNTEWEVIVLDGKEWLTTGSTSGKGNSTITLKATENTDASRRSATVKISWYDDNNTIRNSNVKVAQEGKKEPKPAPTPIVLLTKEEVQSIVSSGLANDRVPDNCKITVNGVNTQYSSFRRDVANNKYTSVQVLSLTPNKTTGNAAIINVKVTQKKIEPISKNEVQAIVSAGKTDSRIPDNCKMVGNGVNTSYKQFRTNVVENKYESVKVESVTPDKNGNAAQIKVKVVRPHDCDDLFKEDIKKIVASGQKSNKVPETCTILINGKSMQYKKYRDGFDFGYYSNVEVTKVECNAKGVATKILVSATVNEGKE